MVFVLIAMGVVGTVAVVTAVTRCWRPQKVNSWDRNSSS